MFGVLAGSTPRRSYGMGTSAIRIAVVRAATYQGNRRRASSGLSASTCHQSW